MVYTRSTLYAKAYITLSQPPAPIFPARYLHSTWNSVGAKMIGVANMPPRPFRRRIVQYRRSSNRARHTARGGRDLRRGI